MPHISVTCCALTQKQQCEFIQKLTAQASEIMKIPEESFTMAILQVPDSSFGIGGQTVDTVREQHGKTQ